MSREMKDSGIEWIGEIPKCWDLKRLKYCSSIRHDKYNDEESVLTYIGLENITSWSGKYIETESEYDKQQSMVFRANDILWGKLRPYLAKVYHAESDGCCSSEFCVIRVSEECDVRFFWNLLISPEFVFTVDRSTYGTKMPRANSDFIKNIVVPIPPRCEQERISAFLDKKSARIDEVIEQTRSSIEEYKKLKQSVITEAVTRGIRPNRTMKKSHVEWIEMIPEEWEMVKGKALFRENDKRSEDGSEELLTVSQYTGITPRSQKNVNMFKAETLEGYKICEIGDIAANTMWLWAGAIGVSQYRGVISPSYNIYRAKGKEYESKYLDYLLRIPPLVQHYASLSTGIRASRLRLYPQQFLSILFPVPPAEEQREIIEYLDRKVDAMDSLIEQKTKLLSELEIYKQTVIYEYVTGKKEVRA